MPTVPRSHAARQILKVPSTAAELANTRRMREASSANPTPHDFSLIPNMAIERLDQTTTTDRLQVALHRARYDFALSHVAGASAILEIGTGCGELSEELSKLPVNYAGVEIDPGAAAQTRARLPAGSRIIETDARQLPFADGEFSHVVCLEVLEHLGDYRPAIEQIRRCLKADGMAIISVPHRKHGGKNPGNPYHLYEPGERELADAFREAFSEVEVFYQYYAETWWMKLARLLHMRRVLGLAEPYRLLSEGNPSQLQHLFIAKEARGLKIILLLVAKRPSTQPLMPT